MAAPKRGLGGGKLGQLQGSNVADMLKRIPSAANAKETLREVPPSEVRASPWQPRAEVDTGSVQELAESVRTHGVLEPLLARALPDGTLELLAGHRRLEAARLAGLQTVPVRVLDIKDDLTAAIVAIVENADRKDLSAWEEAQAVANLRQVLESSGEEVTGEMLAPLMGWSTGKVSERLTIADEITRDVMGRADVGLHDVKQLSKALLHKAAKAATRDEKAAALYEAVHGKPPSWGRPPAAPARRGRPKQAFSLATPKTGRVTFQLRKPIPQLEREEAKIILEQLQPVLDQLRERAES